MHNPDSLRLQPPVRVARNNIFSGGLFIESYGRMAEHCARISAVVSV